MTIDKVIDEILRVEGGYVDHPDDRGGPTNWGITQATARAHGFRGHMRDLPRDTAREIYRRRYVVAPAFDRVATIDGAVGAELVDTGVNMGPAVAARFLQRALNALNDRARHWPDLAVDGQIGPATLKALATYRDRRGVEGSRVLLAALNALQGARYIELAEGRPANESFVYGWLRTRVSL